MISNRFWLGIRPNVSCPRCLAERNSDTPFVAPGQYMKLRQHGRRKPTVRRNHAGKPSEPGEQIVDLSFVGKRPGGVLQWRGIADLQIDRQCRIARGNGPRVAVIGIVEDNNL